MITAPNWAIPDAHVSLSVWYGSVVCSAMVGPRARDDGRSATLGTAPGPATHPPRMSRRYLSVTRRRGVSRRAPLLSRHGDPQLLLWVDGVAVAVVAEVDADPVDLAGEAAGPGRVVRGDGGTGLVADVGCLVCRENHGL